MEKQLPNVTDISQLSNTNININIDMNGCEYVETKGKRVAASLDLKNGLHVQYATNKQVMVKNKR